MKQDALPIIESSKSILCDLRFTVDGYRFEFRNEGFPRCDYFPLENRWRLWLGKRIRYFRGNAVAFAIWYKSHGNASGYTDLPDTMNADAVAIQEHSDRLDEALALIQRASQVTELARVERLAIIKALAEAAQPDR